MRFLDKAGAFLEAAARAVEHRFDFDQSRGKRVLNHRQRPAPLSNHCPSCAEAMLLFASAAERMDIVVGPLSTTRVSGSQAVERMP